MIEIPGTLLSKEDQVTVLCSYVNRYTKQHVPAWAKRPRPDGTAYPVQFASDADWLANTLFRVRRDGSLDERQAFCHSTPTWPDNPELRGTKKNSDFRPHHA